MGSSVAKAVSIFSHTAAIAALAETMFGYGSTEGPGVIRAMLSLRAFTYSLAAFTVERSASSENGLAM